MNAKATFALGVPSFSVVLTKRIPAASPISDMISARIAATKRRLLDGGLLRSVEWRRRSGKKDLRGRQAVTSTPIDAFIEARPALARAPLDTERADDIVLVILDEVAITDSDTFRWGEPPHVYKIKAIDGVLQNEETGVRFASEVVLIR